jgi:hypothetical protein
MSNLIPKLTRTEKPAPVCVKTFIPEMARQVEARTKRNTIRKMPKRLRDVPTVGQRISCREWTGRPYASQQRTLVEGAVTAVCKITITRQTISLHGIGMIETAAARMDFAVKDGFESDEEFDAWFLKDGPVFEGLFIAWEPDSLAT